MEKYVALLRGINISRKNKVSMFLLKIAFEDVGFSDVSTYINSGNVIFSDALLDRDEMIRKCKSLNWTKHRKLKDKLEFERGKI